MKAHYGADELDEMAGEKVRFTGSDGVEHELTRYEGEQKLRGIERKIRYYKKKALVRRSAGVDDTAARRKLGEWQAVARDFVKQTGLRRDYAREHVGVQRTLWNPTQSQPRGKRIADMAGGNTQNRPQASNNSILQTIKVNENISFSAIQGSHTRKQDLRNTNPNFENKRDAPYSINCQRCVSAYEARRRGLNVSAKPCFKDDTTDRLRYMNDKVNGWTAVYKNSDLISCAGNSSDETKTNVSAKMQEWGNGSRAIVRVKWADKYGGGGHVFVAEQIKGKTFFFDPQNNKSNVAYYFERINPEGTYLLRIDNLEFSDKIELCCEDVK